MQQNILLYSEAKTARPFWWSSLDFWVVWAFSRLTTSEDWPFRPLRGLKGQISGLSASLRPGQPRNLARQPKKSCCFSSLYNKIPFPSNLWKHHETAKCNYKKLEKNELKKEAKVCLKHWKQKNCQITVTTKVHLCTFLRTLLFAK